MVAAASADDNVADDNKYCEIRNTENIILIMIIKNA